MALRLAALFLAPLLLLCTLSIPSEGAIPKCCVTTSKLIQPSILRKVESVIIQKSSGVCEVPALILIVKGRAFCAHPAVLKILKKIQKRQGQTRRVKKKEC
ncbi:hypothetical protein AAFF_G00065650 [Aldrovandia affinis]|uniref:Chemokine interleukin-8-like domain-containing protein n=1 Tax=Aldrovandia affinis TaxID=143900 RepID=A0AAD7WYK9_9TELE|nr:hypothetical protein AAFF_G00065650 [Aldrovandia affinis]